MSNKQEENPAYPVKGSNGSIMYSGMSIRTVIAKDIMATIISNPDLTYPDWIACAVDAVKATDALIKELTKDGRPL
jgi:hypothetical protein